MKPDAASTKLEPTLVWIDQHVVNWPAPGRLQLLATLGQQFAARQDKVSASIIWSKCIPQANAQPSAQSKVEPSAQSNVQSNAVGNPSIGYHAVDADRFGDGGRKG